MARRNYGEAFSSWVKAVVPGVFLLTGEINGQLWLVQVKFIGIGINIPIIIMRNVINLKATWF